MGTVTNSAGPHASGFEPVISASPYKGGYIVYSGGQTGPVGLDGEIVEDRVPDFARRAPVRVGYLTAIDPKTRDSNWTASQQMGRPADGG